MQEGSTLKAIRLTHLQEYPTRNIKNSSKLFEQTAYVLYSGENSIMSKELFEKCAVLNTGNNNNVKMSCLLLSRIVGCLEQIFMGGWIYNLNISLGEKSVLIMGFILSMVCRNRIMPSTHLE
jgi:hypothetical protein